MINLGKDMGNMRMFHLANHIVRLRQEIDKYFEEIEEYANTERKKYLLDMNKCIMKDILEVVNTIRLEFYRVKFKEEEKVNENQYQISLVCSVSELNELVKIMKEKDINYGISGTEIH